MRRGWFFDIAGSRSAEGEGEDREHLEGWGVIAATKERGKIEPRFG